MKTILSFSAFVALVTANICNDGTGTWAHAITEGVTDYAYGGIPLNKKYNCFEGCLATGAVAQNFKVALNGNQVLVKEQNFGGIAERLARYMKMREEGVDPNAYSCIDPVLRADVQNALNKVVDHSCKGIVKTLLFNLNRPGWAVNCVDYSEISIGSYVEDVNFCSYLGVVSPYKYEIRLAKIDTS
ncbi:hypothetical protein ANCDUO_22617 [Ancylostoma duodenale]|uniref:Uncharacterized protein n=1 Tax=Ancylostoma duodenale TaxID=51022 RepID=A0A0C2FFD9_9BILA|nr:hypothetical protein ANCDUO_22617 [Ancylostoma duodenale]